MDTRLLRFRVKGSEAPSRPAPVVPPSAANSKMLHENEDDSTESDDEILGPAHHRRSALHKEDKWHEQNEDSTEDALDLEIRYARLQDDQSGGTHDHASEDPRTDDEAEDGSAETTSRPSTGKSADNPNAGFSCMESHDGTSKSQNPNAQTISQLQEMTDMYERTGDQWRHKAFRVAIGRLRRHDQFISTIKEARKIGIGKSVAEQIQEIVSTGRYRRLESAQNNPNNKLLDLFTGVYGAGVITAQEWIAQGYRSLEDLRQKPDLTANQLVGLDHHDDFQQRIPRSEVEKHATIVEMALKAADPNLQLIVGGSYRRGKKDSNDIDCVIFMEDADIVRIRTLMLDIVIPDLMEQGFLQVALAAGHRSRDETSKWHGASALPDSEIWRRIDFLFVPWEELGAALLYFTGNDLFNRSIRLLAGRKGMRLNQHGLYKEVMRGPGRQRVNDGTLVESQDEKRIFEILGVPYRPPQERNV